MKSIRLRSLVLHNFRSFVGTHRIDFDETGLVILKGRSGYGKSSILMAITYALGIAPYSAKDLQSWHSEEPMWVELHLDTHEGPAVLRRGDKKTSLTVNEETVKGAVKAVEDRLDALCGVNKDLRRALTYREQDAPSLFMTMKDSEQKEFLTNVLGLDWLEEEIETRTEALSKLRSEVEAAEAKVEATQAFDDATPDPTPPNFKSANDVLHQQDLLNKELAVIDADLQVLRYQLEAETKKAQHKIADLDAEIVLLNSQISGIQNIVWTADSTAYEAALAKANECQIRIQKAKERDRIALSEFMSEKRKKDAQYQQHMMEIGKIDGYASKIKGLIEEVNFLKSGKCFSCKQEWVQNQTAVDEKIKEIEKYTAAIEGANALKPFADIIKEEIQAAPDFVPNPMIANMEAVYNTLSQQAAAELQKMKTAEATANSDSARKVAELRGQIEVINLKKVQTMAAATVETQELIDALEVKKSSIGQRKFKLGMELAEIGHHNNAEARLHQAAVEKKETSTALLASVTKWAQDRRATFNVETDYLGCLKGFLNNIFDEVLEEIGAEASSILARFANTDHITVQFKSEKQTLKGTSKSVINMTANFNGEERPIKSGCSGGMYTSIQLAVDLAVSRVVARRTGVNLGLLMLDEAFNGHDPVIKESCLEILKEHAADKLVIIIDHSSEFKEHFNKVLEIDNENGRSVIL